MKKFILPVVFAFVCFTHTAMSQGFRIAPTVGVNGSGILYSSAFRNGLNSSTINTTTGLLVKFQAGALLDYAFSDRFSIRSGVLYTGKGGSLAIKLTQNGVTQSAQGSYEFNYIDVPLLLNIAVGESGFRIMGGPVVGIALNAKTIVQASNGTNLESRTLNYSIGNSTTDQVLPLDLSASLGLVKELQVGDRPLEIGIRAQPSFSKWTTISKTVPDRYARNLLVGLRITYLFALGR